MPTEVTRHRHPLRCFSMAGCGMVLAGVSAAVHAQEGLVRPAGNVRGIDITPAITVTQSWSDNRDLSAVDRSSEFLTVVSPNVRVAAQGEQYRGALDYTLNLVASDNPRTRDGVRHGLAANLVLEPIRRLAYVDFRASIAQQSISAFGVQSSPGSNPLSNANRSEVRSLTVSPYLRGTIANSIDVEGRVTFNRTNAVQAANASNSSRVGSLRINGGRGVLRWGATATRTINSYDNGRETTTDAADANLEYVPHYDWRVNGRVGRERTDVFSILSESNASWGIGAAWNPSARTDLTANFDERFFGSAYRFAANYRTPRTVWRLSATRDSSSANQGTLDSSIIDAYDRLFPELAALYPDPVERDRVIRELLVRQQGLLNSAISLQQRVEFSGAWNGVRATASVSLSRTTTSRLDRVSQSRDDLTLVDRVSQTGMNVGLGYRLSQTGRLAGNLSRQSTAGRSGQSSNTLTTLNVSWVEQLWAKATLSASLRRTSFDANPFPYSENGASVTFSLRF